jgi:YHS domain-containing protein
VLRFLVLLIAGFLLFLVIRATVMSFFAGLRGGPGRGRRRPGSGTRDELVKDPVCGTYIPRGKAVARQTDSGPRYFCSGACAARFLAGSADRRGGS